MLANIRNKTPFVIAGLILFSLLSGCASNAPTNSNTQVTSENSELIIQDVLSLVKAILVSAEFPKKQVELAQNDPLFKKFGALKKPKKFDTIDIVSDDPNVLIASKEGSANSWTLKNVSLVAKQIYTGSNDTHYSLLSKQLMNVENQSGMKYRLYINKTMTYKTHNDLSMPDQGAFVVAANNSNLYAVIRDGKLDINLDLHGTGKF